MKGTVSAHKGLLGSEASELLEEAKENKTLSHEGSLIGKLIFLQKANFEPQFKDKANGQIWSLAAKPRRQDDLHVEGERHGG